VRPSREKLARITRELNDKKRELQRAEQAQDEASLEAGRAQRRLSQAENESVF